MKSRADDFHSDYAVAGTEIFYLSPLLLWMVNNTDAEKLYITGFLIPPLFLEPAYILLVYRAHLFVI